ncbi:hypothetical protein KVR01_010616 [Diaporthe batatas]|uniref:uncharacterized protein n=1 Tax=Diaporthe batatas TaxID=748121 RepID=UPI001D040D23|nr:uncharacterized protein KVR01_010616 [Diaporthe batatas]KAG8159979.1 hypothetical protein KVR01_010616 [Diaporthe batatas]
MASTTSGQCICGFPRQCSGAELVGTIRIVFKHEYLETHSGSTYRRQHICGSNSTNWTRVTTEVVRPMTPPPDKSLWVIRQRQEGKGPHWSLFAAVDDDSDSPVGRVWQVNGDPDVGMYYAHRENSESGVGIQMFLTAAFADDVFVCSNLSEHWEAKVDKIANTIKPPGPIEGVPRRNNDHRCNCMNWVWQVLEELVKEGIVPSEAAEKARNLPDLEPTE